MSHDSQSSLSGDTGRGDADRALTLRSIRTLVDVLAESVDFSKLHHEEAERFMSLVGGLVDQLEESESPARRNESAGSGATGTKVKPPQPEVSALIGDLMSQHNAACGALRRLRAGFKNVCDERDRLKSAAALALLRYSVLDAPVAVALRTALDPSPRETGRVEAPPAPAFDASDYERPPKVIHLGPNTSRALFGGGEK